MLSSAKVIAAAGSNSTLLSYLYPSARGAERWSVRDEWSLATRGCRVVPNGCYCFHVTGSMVKEANPRGAERCAPKDVVLDCTSDPKLRVMARRNCSCFAQRAGALACRRAAPDSCCLFSDMRPLKLLAIIAACRAAGVTHIVEQGRYGGLSAHMYALHGFKVTSIEFLPLSEVSDALRTVSAGVRLVDADGRRAVVRAVESAPRSERIGVIFDGEKRATAYETFGMVKPRIALAVFDDTNLDGGDFPRLLRERGEDAWHTWDCDFVDKFDDTAVLKRARERMVRAIDAGEQRAVRFHGGMESLSLFHSTIVRGGRWGEKIRKSGII